MSNNIRNGKWSPSRAAVLLALAPTAVIVALSILLASFKVTEEDRPKASMADCQAINEAQARLACYDMLAKQSVPMPAKGGQAILSDDGQR